MSDMTWGEFKQVVEGAGVTDAMTIEWIDVSHPDMAHVSTRPDVDIEKDGTSFTVCT